MPAPVVVCETKRNASVDLGVNASKNAPVKTVTFEIPLHLAGLIIGKNGCFLQRIHMETNCKVVIDDKKGLCTITGAKLTELTKARQQVEEIVRNNRDRSVIQLPIDYLGMIIGVRGSNAADILQKTKCRFQVEK